MKQNGWKLKNVVLPLFLTGLNTQTSFAQELSATLSTTNASTNNSAVAATSNIEANRQYFIAVDKLNVRSSLETKDRSNVIGQLAQNDTVIALTAADSASPLVKIQIVKSSSFTSSTTELYVSKDYLTENPIVTPASKYFVVQNIATEKTRVYERCTTSPGCPHKLVYESNMVVGRPEVGSEKDPHAFKTWLGHAKIAQWVKFYQDTKGHYPHWYKAGQDISTIPPKAPRDSNGVPESSLRWGQKWLTKDSQGKETNYGAFGWYAAKLTPSDEVNGVNYQWIHGTMGWGSDGDAAIELTRSVLLNIFANPGSAGCTRLSNANVAYLNSLLAPGTDIYRVYARETTRTNPCQEKGFTGSCKRFTLFPGYENQTKPKTWNFTLTTDGAQQANGAPADPDLLAKLGISITPSNLIEKGSLEVDQYPTPLFLNYTHEASSGKSGDRYQIDEGTEEATSSNFTGYYLVEEGRFVDYKHPSTAKTNGKIIIGGLQSFRTQMPEELMTAGKFYKPEMTFKKSARESRK